MVSKTSQRKRLPGVKKAALTKKKAAKTAAESVAKLQLHPEDLGNLSVELEFARKLAANDKLLRQRAIRNLWRWLRSQSETGKRFSQKELRLVWKGLYYCMWMCDKPTVQEELADNIVKLVKCFETAPSSTLNFFDTFFYTMSREYFRIDRFRLDKFLMLTRRMLQAAFRWAQSLDWSATVVSDLMSRLGRHVFSGDDAACAEGLQSFLAEIFLQELTKTLEMSAGDTEKDLTPIFLHFCDVMATSKTQFLRSTFTTNIFEGLRKHTDVANLVNIVTVATYALDNGKKETCLIKNRRALYYLYTLFSTSNEKIVRDKSSVAEDV